MRQLLVVLALGLIPVGGNAAALIEIPAENGIRIGDVWDVSADGQVLVGECSVDVGDGGPCRWSAAAGYQLLERPPESGGPSYALATSGDGSVVVGSWQSTTETVAVRWGADGNASPLEPAAGSVYSEAWAVSGDGSVIAGFSSDGEWNRPFRWTEATGMEVGPSGGFAFGVSADGSTVAACCIPSRFSHWPDVPYLWRSGAEPKPLPMIHRSGGDMAYGISADGKVALLGPGWAGVVGFAWRWSAREGAQPVVKPRPSLLSPRPHDASYDGSAIVGTTDGYFGSGFLWRAGTGDRLLRDVLADAGVDVSGWSDFVDSRAISDDACRIPATGVRSNGERVVVLLVLCGDEVGSAPPLSAPAAPLGLAIVLLAIPLAMAGRRPLGLALLLCLPGAAQAAGLVPLDEVTSAEALSGDGAVVAGRCSGAEKGRLCRWRPATGVEWLETPASFVAIEAISFDGSTVVGSRSAGSGDRAVLWNAAGELEDLSGVPDLLASQALHVSADGSVVLGAAYILLTPYTAVWRPFRWTREAGMELLPFDGAHPVQASGDGSVLLVHAGIDAFLWRIGEEPVAISGPGGAPFHATALSADGNTVAGAEDFYPGALPLRWTAAEGAVTLGPIAYPFFLQPTPSDASADGAVVVGSDEVAGAFVWDAARGLQRLGDLLAGRYGVNVSAWDFTDVSRVSDDGRTALATGYENGAYKSVLVNLAPACDDGLDNDADGLIDLADPHCVSPSHPSERQPGCGLGFELALLLPLLAARRRRRSVRPVVAVLVLGLAPAAGNAAALLELGGPGQELEAVAALSGDGHFVAGWCVAGACVGEPGGPFESILPLRPRALSHDGSVVVGAIDMPDGWWRAARWTAATGAQLLADAPPGTIWSDAFDVSADGSVVVGAIAVGDPGSVNAFRWSQAGGFELFAPDATALGVSADGAAVVGRVPLEGATAWLPGETPLLLNPPDWIHEAYAISDDHRVVVGGVGAGGGGGPLVAWRWSQAAGLEVLDEAWLASFATAWDVSADGSAVLGTGGDAGWHFLWREETGARPLGELLGFLGVPSSGLELRLGQPSLSADGRRVAGNAWRGDTRVPYLAVLGPGCDDGLDNDGDGQVDLADPQCLSPAQRSERRAGCGLGFELALLLPPLAARARRRAERPTRTRP